MAAASSRTFVPLPIGRFKLKISPKMQIIARYFKTEDGRKKVVLYQAVDSPTRTDDGNFHGCCYFKADIEASHNFKITYFEMSPDDEVWMRVLDFKEKAMKESPKEAKDEIVD